MIKVFNDNSLINLSNSILKCFDLDTYHPTIPEIDKLLNGHKKIVVVLFDGMGKNIVEKHLDKNSFIRTHRVITINSTFPPTTAAATTSFLTGKYPIETGWLAWTTYFKDYDKNIILFRGIDYNTGENLNKPGEVNIADRYFPNDKIYELINNSKPGRIGTNVQRFPVQKDGPKSLRSGLRKIRRIIKDNKEAFIYFYWDSPDREMHEFGIKDKKVHKEVLKAEWFMKKACKQNKDTLFILLADHGHINVKGLDICEHDDLYSLIDKPIGLEKRTPSFFIKEGKCVEFAALFKKYYGEHFVLLDKESVLKMKVFGEGNPREGVIDTFGDFIAISIDEYALYESKNQPHDFDYKGHHGGGTKEEREIDVSIFLPTK